jgi:hypothetical protein
VVEGALKERVVGEEVRPVFADTTVVSDEQVALVPL